MRCQLHSDAVARFEKPFLMPVEDIFTIQGRGTVATGRVERGKVKVNETVEIVGIKDTRSTVVTGVEMFKKLLDEGTAGDNVGLLLRGVERKDIERGQVIAKPGSITPHTKFKAEAYVLTKEEGGRHTPFFTGYRPQFYFRTTDVTGVASLPQGVEMVPGVDNVVRIGDRVVELIAPIAMEKDAVRIGGVPHTGSRTGRRWNNGHRRCQWSLEKNHDQRHEPEKTCKRKIQNDEVTITGWAITARLWNSTRNWRPRGRRSLSNGEDK